MWVNNASLQPRRLLTVGSWWVMREVEIGNASVDDVRIVSDIEVALNLPASKTDIAALGAVRSHRYSCGGFPGAPELLDPALCPCCPLRGEFQWASARASVGTGAPLFPTVDDEYPPKQLIIDTISEAAKMLKIPLLTSSGQPRWGGGTRCDVVAWNI